MAVSIVPPVPEPHFETIRVGRTGGVVTVTLDRPQRKNAASMAMFDELLDVFRTVAADPKDRVLVITGAGDAFCSGADLSDAVMADSDGLTRMRRIGEVCIALHRVPQPTIAKINGVAAGAGLNLALTCDLIVASDAARFSEIFARRGLSIDFGGSWLLPRLVGVHRAKELALLAEIIDAHEADRIGLVNRVVPAAELDRFVDDWAARLADGPSIALGLTKRLIDEAFSSSLEEAIEAEARCQVVNFGTDDSSEALTAFTAKREPHFRGR